MCCGRQVLEGIWSGAGRWNGLLTGDLVDVNEGCFGASVSAGVYFEEDGDELDRDGERG